MIISRKVEQNVWDLDTLFKALNGQLEAIERCVLVGTQNYSEQSQANNPFGQLDKPRQSPPTAAALVTQTRNVNCNYCRHSSINCKKESRILGQERICSGGKKMFYLPSLQTISHKIALQSVSV